MGKKDAPNFTLLRSTDSGSNWSVPAGLPGGGEDLVAIATVNSFVIAVGKKGTILVSEDQGATWVAQISGTGNDLKAAAAINPVIAVGNGGTVLVSNDQATAGAAAAGAAAAGGVGGPIQGFFPEFPEKEEVKNVPFGAEWLALLLILLIGLRRVH